jgi:guanosine-3',5'-bis(diphosphate) 3'-pyrophosphohydrolase
MINHQLILNAADFAAYKHRNQKRKDEEKTPYINHPIAVAKIISEIGNIEDPEILAAALLHDTIEDTKTTPEELIENFGERVCHLVQEVTDDKTLPKLERKQRQIDHAKEISKDAALIKLGDKISNVTDITYTPPTHWDNERRLEYLEWAEEVINNCPKVNEALENHFAEVVRKGKNLINEK